MKLKTLTPLLIPLCAGLLASLVTANALANQVLIVNKSKQPYRPITLTYEIAYKDPGKPVTYKLRPPIKIMDNTTISFNLAGHKLGGIVPVAVDGHHLPSDEWFNKPDECALTTDKIHTNGKLTFLRSHHQVTCAVRGGIFG